MLPDRWTTSPRHAPAQPLGPVGNLGADVDGDLDAVVQLRLLTTRPGPRGR